MSSDSASSEVTYTSISSHGDPLAWAVDFFRLQEPDSPEAAPASPDYVPGPEEPEQAPLSPDYVPGPEYPEYLAPSDEEVPVEEIVVHDYQNSHFSENQEGIVAREEVVIPLLRLPPSIKPSSSHLNDDDDDGN
ncbi:hypothetical protein Tco_0189688 [Tanacetum coccineum]